MWEAIRANRRKTILLFVGMGGLLVVLGYVLGEAYFPPDGGILGVILVTAIWIIWSLVGYFKGDAILLKFSRAQEVTHDVHPQLFNVVEEMKIAGSLPAMPKIYIIDEEAPNAFATGRTPEKSAIAITAGLLAQLNRDELQGVIAHEMSHIINRDVQFITYAGIMLGTIVIIAEFFIRGFWFTSSSSRRYRSSKKSDSNGVMMVIALVFAIAAPILARLLYLALSRRREYLADASAVRLTRYPEGLASALEKIARSPQKLVSANKVSAPMYIINPFQKTGRALLQMFSTHPPTEDRIKVLRSLSQGVNYANYTTAFQQITGKRMGLKSMEEDTERIAIRAGSSRTVSQQVSSAETSTDEQDSQETTKRKLGNLMMTLNGYRFSQCECGMKYKIPPDFTRSQFTCRRCQRTVTVPETS